jgi:hypothetical protein
MDSETFDVEEAPHLIGLKLRLSEAPDSSRHVKAAPMLLDDAATGRFTRGPGTVPSAERLLTRRAGGVARRHAKRRRPMTVSVRRRGQ